jgi:hypothetical protein
VVYRAARTRNRRFLKRMSVGWSGRRDARRQRYYNSFVATTVYATVQSCNCAFPCRIMMLSQAKCKRASGPSFDPSLAYPAAPYCLPTLSTDLSMTATGLITVPFPCGWASPLRTCPCVGYANLENDDASRAWISARASIYP